MCTIVYLVQHGEAKPESEDPDRPLTARGREDVLLVARHAAGVGVKVERVLHSGKLRAKQTAEILANHLHPAGGVEETSGLSPMDPPESARSVIEGAKEPVMIVGHLPHLSRLLSLIVIGNPEMEVVRFRTGEIVSLAKSDKKWSVAWILTPDIVRR